MDEHALIRAAQEGEAKAFEALLQQHYDTVYRFALRWCGHTSDAEDIAQLACIKLARTIGQFQFESAFSTWLYRLVINCAKDWQRQQARHRTADVELDDHALGESAPRAEAMIYLQQILRAVEAWGEEFKETLLLVFAEGCSHAEAAHILGVQESTISWRIHTLRKKLRLQTQSGGSL